MNGQLADRQPKLLEAIVFEIKRQKIREFPGDSEINISHLQSETGSRVQCPFCMYDGKTAKVFSDGSIKCFACGIFRRQQ